MKNLKYFIIFIFFFFISFNVNALINNDTTYNVYMPNMNDQLNVSCGNENVKDVISDLIENTDFSTSYYHLFIGQPFHTYNTTEGANSIYFYLIPKSFYNRFYLYGSSNQLKLYFNWYNRTVGYWYRLRFDNCINGTNSTNITTSSSWIAFLSALNNGSIVQTSDDIGFLSSSISTNSPSYPGDSTLDFDTSISNTSNYDFDKWFYFSDIDIKYNFVNKGDGGNSVYLKKLYLFDNDTYYIINNDDILPSYYDIYGSGGGNSEESSFIGYSTTLNTFYTNLNVSNVSNYQLKFNFNLPYSVLLFDDNIEPLDY